LIVPRYDGGGFAALPATVAGLFGVGEGGVALDGLPARADRVLLVLLDAFGWRFFVRHGDHPLLRRTQAVARLTTMFPSTTSAHVTTLHTGAGVGEHGLYEWNVYDPGLDALVTPLLFSFAGDGARDTLVRAGADPHAVLPSMPTLYERLGEAGVASAVFAPAAFAPSTYDSVLARGARVHPIGDLASGLAAAGAMLRLGEPAYAYLSSSASRQRTAAVANSGDDGPCTWPTASTSSQPAGSARDLFLHCRPEAIDEVVAGLTRVVGERATVHHVEEIVAAGWFVEVGERLCARPADVCVLPAAGETVWWRERGRFDMGFRGHHGGLSQDEARTQVAALVV
jgi:type I phosphodiesterase/nucleotide pyrophosphatase